MDYQELKRLAEAAKACAHLSYYTSHEGDFQVAASPDVVLKLLTELDRLRTQNQALREALKDTAQTLAWMQHGKCRGFSAGLLTTDQALDKARAALTQAEGGV